MANLKLLSKAFKKEYSGQRGTSYIFNLDFEGQARVSAFCNDRDGSEWQEGQTYDVEITPASNPDHAGTVKKVKSNFSGGGGGFSGTGAKMAEATLKAAVFTGIVELVKAGKIEVKDLSAATLKLYAALKDS